MAVDVDICNSALVKLGAGLINDLSDNSKEARLCASQYPKVRDAVLRSAPWSFAIRRATLTQVVGANLEFGEEKVFALPADCVRVWKLSGGYRYKIEGRRLLADGITSADIQYVSKNVPVAHYDAEFQEAVACMLAADLAYSLTQSSSLKQELQGTAKFWIDQARSTNSQEQTPENFDFNDWINIRGQSEVYY